MMFLFCVFLYLSANTLLNVLNICTNNWISFHWFLLFYEVEWQNLKAIFMKLKSTKTTWNVCFSWFRKFPSDLVYHHCKFGPSGNYDSCQRCTDDYVSICLHSCGLGFSCDLSEVENRDPFEIFEWSYLANIYHKKLYGYLMLNIEVIEPGLFMVIARGFKQ